MKTFPRYMAYPVLFALGIKFRVTDHRKQETPPAIYIFNHSSTLDIPIFLALGLERFRVVAKWELQYIPFFFIIGRLTGQVFIKRQNSEKAIERLLKTYDRLKRDDLNLVIAPEGSRKHEGVIGPFKKGAFRMAIDLGYPIVPIYFEGNDKLSLGGSLFSKSGEINAHIHPPVDTSDWNIETLEDHIDGVREMYLKWAGVEE
ncbi:MAG: lysophospholipid acyltransferase family protein [Balneola sp.]